MKEKTKLATQPPSRDELWQQLSNAVALRSSEDQTLWASFGTFWATHAILLVALFTTGQLPDGRVGAIIAAVGVIVSLMWHGIQRRALGHLARHEAAIDVIERELNVPARFAMSSEISRDLYGKHVPKGLRARTIMSGCSIGGAFVWFVAFVLFVATL